MLFEICHYTLLMLFEICHYTLSVLFEICHYTLSMLLEKFFQQVKTLTDILNAVVIDTVMVSL